jgi:hypothetical protein
MSTEFNPFLFDVNFGFGADSIFTTGEQEGNPPMPPIEGYFLLLDGTNFLLLDGEDLTLL